MVITYSPLIYDKHNTTLTTVDETTIVNNPYQFDVNREHTLTIIDAGINSKIPNVYAYGDENNAFIQVTQDGGTSWTDIQLTTGIYSINNIQQAITDMVGSWYTSTADPAIVIRGNSVTNYSYFILDTTKTTAGTQVGIKLNATDSSGRVSSFGTLLGFTTTTELLTDGTHASDIFPKIDWFGNAVYFRLKGFGGVSTYNGNESEIVAELPLSTTGNVPNEYTLSSSGYVPFEVPCRVGSTLNNFRVEVVGDRDLNKPILMYDGRCFLKFIVKEY